MKVVLAFIAVVICVGLPALAGAYAIQEGINQAIEWKEQYREGQKGKENQGNA